MSKPQAYWRKLKERLKKEGNESVANCHALKMWAANEKMRLTNVAEAFGLRKQSRRLLECAKRAVEIAIEQDEATAMQWLETAFGILANKVDFLMPVRACPASGLWFALAEG